MQKWILKKAKINYNDILDDFKIDPLLAKILSKKDFKTKAEIYNYLYPSKAQIHDPFLLNGMDQAVKLIKEDIKHNRKILISLDYDVDGIVSGAIAYRGLSRLGANCSYILPHRVKDGYGINERIVNKAFEEKFDTIITFDNGIAAFEPIALAKKLGIKTIVTDHHDIPFSIDDNEQKIYKEVEADVVINPKHHKCNYPFEGICAGTIAYKLICALYREYNIPEKETEELLALASIATICDVMELKDENRAVVSFGLQHLKNTENLGLRALFEIYNLENVAVDDIGFKIGPCFNSSGRLSTAEMGLEVLTNNNRELVYSKTQELFNLNCKRKEMTLHAFCKALEQIEAKALHKNKIILIYMPEIHESISGIVASRVKDRYNRPVIVFADSEDIIKGSARSVEDVNIFEQLSNHKEMLSKFGGHPMAAGMSLEKPVFSEFCKALTASINNLDFSIQKTYKVDLILPFTEIDESLAQKLKQFEPYGKGNEKVIFSTTKIFLSDYRILGKNQNVLKLTFSQAGKHFDFIAFGDISEIENIIKNKVQLTSNNDIISSETNTFDILYTIGTNVFNGRERLQLELLSIR